MKLTIQRCWAALLVVAALILSACGTKGDLYLPETDPAEQAETSENEAGSEDDSQS